MLFRWYTNTVEVLDIIRVFDELEEMKQVKEINNIDSVKNDCQDEIKLIRLQEQTKEDRRKKDEEDTRRSTVPCYVGYQGKLTWEVLRTPLPGKS